MKKNCGTHRPPLKTSYRPIEVPCTFTGSGGSGSKSLLDEFPGAAAGYSLRRIGESGPVVELRRASDSVARDFTAAELTGSVTGDELVTNGDFSDGSTGWTLGNAWSIAGGQVVLDGSQTSNNLLKQNGISGYSGVQGIFKLSFDITCNDYNNFKVVVPSGVPNTFQLGITADGSYSVIFDTRAGTGNWGDVNFYSGVNGVTATIDNVSLKAYTPTAAEQWVIDNAGLVFSGSGITKQDSDSAYVSTWYDQSENGFHASQSVATLQPLLIRAGVTNTAGAGDKPSIRFSLERETNLLTESWNNIAQPLTQFGVGQLATIASTECMASGVRSNTRCHMSYSNTSKNFAMYGGTSLTTNIPGNTNHNLFTGIFNGSSSKFVINGITGAAGDAGNYSLGNKLVIGAQQTGDVTNWDGDIQEFIVWPSDQSENRVEIETDINTFYNVF